MTKKTNDEAIARERRHAEKQITVATPLAPDAKALTSSEWVGEAPPLTPDANGWWWLWWGNEWCISRVRFEECLRGEGRHYFWVTTMRSTGAISGGVIKDVGAERWGGRLAVPGASPTGKLCEHGRDGAPVKEQP